MFLLPALLNLFAPPRCLGCQREGAALCVVCAGRLRPPRSARCLFCHGDASPQAIACSTCLAQAELSSLQAACAYDGLGLQAVVALKFHGNQAVATAAAPLLASMAAYLPRNTLVTHMPATAPHIRQRGYDQAALLARAVARQLSLPHRTVFGRHGSHHQLGADRAQRLTALADALFIPRPAQVHGSTILIIDDVLTTGASLSTAAHVLRAAGAVAVHGLTFAQA